MYRYFYWIVINKILFLYRFINYFKFIFKQIIKRLKYYFNKKFNQRFDFIYLLILNYNY